jgi:hypothetical protein
MPRKKTPNPRSKPSPRAVFIKEIRKNAPDNPAQTSASEPGKPWYWARRQATAVHRPNRQGTISVATRETSSVIAAVLGRSKIARRQHLRLPRLRFVFSRVDVRDRLPVEITSLMAVLEDVVNTLEAMGLHLDNPLYDRVRAALEQRHE